MTHNAFITSTRLNTRLKSKAFILTAWLTVPYFPGVIYEVKNVSRNALASFRLSPFAKSSMCNNRIVKSMHSSKQIEEKGKLHLPLKC